MSLRTPATDFPSPTASLYAAAIAGDEQGMIQVRLLLAAIIDEAQEAIFSNTLDGIITTWNSAAEQLFGYAADEIIGMPSSLFVPPSYLLEEEILVDHICKGNLPAPFETIRRNKTEDALHVTLTLSPVKNPAGEVVGVSTIVRNTSEPRQIVDALRRSGALRQAQHSDLEDGARHVKTLPTTDSLTGLKNHRVFQEWLRKEVDQAVREDAPLSMLLIDIDRFKSYNDRFGHSAGDSVLQKIAEVLKAAAGTTDQIARYGGEEFAIVLPETDGAGAKAKAERFRTAIELAPWPHCPITVSMGVATFGLPVTSPTALIAQAEQALAASKERGRSSITHAADRRKSEPRPETPSIVLQHLETLQTDSFTSASDAIKQSLQASYDATVEGWARLLDMRDKETEGHNKRVTALMVRLAQHLGMSAEEVLCAKWGAQLHDIGKMAVPDEILHKRGALSVEEWVEIRRHPAIAYEMLAPIEFLGSAVDVAYCHHEKWDGTGYPRALRGNAIPLLARLFAVIDVFDALCSDRSYRDGWPEHRVCEYLRRQAGTHFDPQAVDAFLEMLEAARAAAEPTQYASVA